MISSRDISASQRLKSSLVFFRYFLHVRNFAKKFKYSEESFGAFFDTVFVAEENSGLHKRIFFMNLFHESFPILVFEGSLLIEIALK